MSIIRLTYDGDPPTNQTLREEIPLSDEDYLYITATSELARRRRDLSSSAQQLDGEGVLRFDEVVRFLLRGKRLATRYEQRICLLRGLEAATRDRNRADTIRHDAAHWLEALQELEQRGDDLTAEVSEDFRSQLVVPSMATTLQSV